MNHTMKRIDDLMAKIGTNRAGYRSYEFTLEDGSKEVPDDPIMFVILVAVGQRPGIVAYKFVGTDEPNSLVEALVSGGSVWDDVEDHI